MNQKIKLVTATFGCIDVAVIPSPWNLNTYIIGNKYIDFSHILPNDISLEACNFYITIFDGVKQEYEVCITKNDEIQIFKGSAYLETPSKSTILPYDKQRI